MFLKYFTPKLIPKQTKQRIVKEEHFGKKNLQEKQMKKFRESLLHQMIILIKFLKLMMKTHF